MARPMNFLFSRAEMRIAGHAVSDLVGHVPVDGEVVLAAEHVVVRSWPGGA